MFGPSKSPTTCGQRAWGGRYLPGLLSAESLLVLLGVVRLLLEAYPNASKIKDNHAKTPMDIAEDNWKGYLFPLLSEEGVKKVLAQRNWRRARLAIMLLRPSLRAAQMRAAERTYVPGGTGHSNAATSYADHARSQMR